MSTYLPSPASGNAHPCAQCGQPVLSPLPVSLCWKCSGHRHPVQEVIALGLDLHFYSSSGIRIRLIEIDGWPKVMMEVDEDATPNALRDALPLAIQWRDWLREHQGPWLRGGRTETLEDLCDLQDRGASWAQLAAHVNEAVAAMLCEHAAYLKELDAARPQFTMMGDFFLWQSKANAYTREHAKVLLREFRLAEEEINALLQSGMERIAAGQCAFPPDYPVGMDLLRETLRYWRKGKKHRLALALRQ